MKINYKKGIIKITIFFFLFQVGLIEIVPQFFSRVVEYSDEFIAIVLLLYIFRRAKSVDYIDKRLICICILLMLIGGVSSLKNKIQPLFPSVVDGVICAKFFLFFVGFHLLWKKTKYTKVIFYEMNTFFRIIAVALFGLIIINLFFEQIFPVYDYRNHIYSQKLFFRNTVDLAVVCMNGLLIMMFNSKIYKGNLVYMLMYTLTAISTMRYKELSIVLVAWIIYLYMIVGKMRSKLFLVVGVFIAVIFFGYDQFSLYYRNANQARFLLMQVGLILAKKYFPLGAGFACFGSHMSGEYYSPIYVEYGLNKVWGLGASYTGYVSDNSFSLVLGQFGCLGLLLLLFLYFFLIKESLKIKDKYCFLVAISLVLYLCVSAFGSSSIFHPFAVYNAIMLSNVIVDRVDNQP